MMGIFKFTDHPHTTFFYISVHVSTNHKINPYDRYQKKYRSKFKTIIESKEINNFLYNRFIPKECTFFKEDIKL